MCGIVKVIDVLAESNKSWEDANDDLISLVGYSAKNIESIHIESRVKDIDTNHKVKYRIKAKVAVLLHL